MGKNYIDWIIIGLLFVCMLSGYRKGALSTLKWVIGIIIGLLLTPVLSNFVISILTNLGITGAITSSFSPIGAEGFIIPKIMSLIAFVIIMFASKCLATIMLPSPPHQGIAKLVDGIGGAAIGVLQVCFVIWIISYLCKISTYQIPIDFSQSAFFTKIAQYNGLQVLYNIFPIK